MDPGMGMDRPYSTSLMIVCFVPAEAIYTSSQKEPKHSSALSSVNGSNQRIYNTRATSVVALNLLRHVERGGRQETQAAGMTRSRYAVCKFELYCVRVSVAELASAIVLVLLCSLSLPP